MSWGRSGRTLPAGWQVTTPHLHACESGLGRLHICPPASLLHQRDHLGKPSAARLERRLRKPAPFILRLTLADSLISTSFDLLFLSPPHPPFPSADNGGWGAESAFAEPLVSRPAGSACCRPPAANAWYRPPGLPRQIRLGLPTSHVCSWWVCVTPSKDS